MLADSRLNRFELSHFVQISATSARSLIWGSNKRVGSSWCSCVGSNSSELIHLFKNSLILLIFPLLLIGSMLFVLCTQNGSNRCWGTVSPSERWSDFFYIYEGFVMLSIVETGVTWPSNPHCAVDFSPQLGLVQTSCDFSSCCNLVETTEVLIIEWRCLLGFIFILPVRCYYINIELKVFERGNLRWWTPTLSHLIAFPYLWDSEGRSLVVLLGFPTSSFKMSTFCDRYLTLIFLISVNF